MFDIAAAEKQLLAPLDAHTQEAERIFTNLVLPTWGTALHGFPHTLYGFMMATFARIDLLSAYWRGDAASKGQTERMIDFMDAFIHQDREANAVAVQMWRHKLMHTAEPRYLRDDRTGRHYRWLLHWSHHLPREQHFRFTDTTDSRILNIALLYLIEDVKRGAEAYVKQLAADSELQRRYLSVDAELSSYGLRVYW